MKIKVSVKPGSKREAVEAVGPLEFKVWVKEPPADGKANEGVIRSLAQHFSVPKSSVRILRGGSGRQKLIEVVLKQ